MRYALAVAILASGLWFSNAWAESDHNMALQATITMEQAIKAAADTMPGSKPYEVEMDKENGRPTYKVKLVDAAKKTSKVFVDAQSGKIVEKR